MPVARPRPEAVETLARLIEEHGLNQGDAACVLGLPDPYGDGRGQVNRWLNGRITPPVTLQAAVDGARLRLHEFPRQWRERFDRERRERAAVRQQKRRRGDGT